MSFVADKYAEKYKCSRTVNHYDERFIKLFNCLVGSLFTAKVCFRAATAIETFLANETPLYLVSFAAFRCRHQETMFAVTPLIFFPLYILCLSVNDLPSRRST